MNSSLGVGIVGCGGAAADLALAMAEIEDVRLVAAHDSHEQYALKLAAAHGGIVHQSIDDLVSDPAVDIVYIALPHHLLASYAELALIAGKHVLVEKPMALYEDSVQALHRLAKERGLVLGVNFELREAGSVREARQLVRGAAIGEICSIRIRTVIDKPDSYWSSGPRGTVPNGWRSLQSSAGGGVVLMNSIHQLDVVRHVTGLGFARVMAESATLTAQVEVEDCAAAVFRLSNGGVASLVAAAHSPGAFREERIEIDGAHGRLDLPDPYGDGALRMYLRRPWQQFSAGMWHDILPVVVNNHVELLRGFLQAVKTDGPPPAGADDAAAALATVLAIYRSAASGQAVDICPLEPPP